jgi:molecular chaperone GrpE
MTEGKKIDIEGGDTSRDNDGQSDPEKASTARENREDENSLKRAADELTDQSADELKAELEQKTREAEENYDRLLRISADFENYKKRTAREMDDFKKFANQSLIKELLPVVDNLELAIKSSAESENSRDANLLDGVELTRKEILKVFENFNVEPIDALGQAFDPNFHEAVMREESDEVPENTVVNELQKGYLMNERLLRPSMVVVAMPKKTPAP